MTKLKTRVISGTLQPLQPRKCPHPQPHIPTPKKWDKDKRVTIIIQSAFKIPVSYLLSSKLYVFMYILNKTSKCSPSFSSAT